MKILCLTVSAGSGHIKAAEALEKYFLSHYENIHFETVDTLKYINPIIDKIIVGGYLKSLKRTPSLYGKLYKFAETEDALSNLSSLVNELLSIKIKGLIEELNPDVIVCTHPFPIEMVSKLKKKNKVEVPCIAILTDYAPHSFWFYSHIDAYVIPNEDFIQDLIEKGISRDTIYPLGIPVSEEFLITIDKKEAKSTLELDDKFTILLMGGGLGIGNIKDIFEKLAFSKLDIQIIACAGQNVKLKNQLLEISSRSYKKTVIFDYTDNINLLMSASDLLISKPGGLTITEALIKELPIVINSVIPGQEEKNADYLLNNGIAARIYSEDSVISILMQIMNSKVRLKHMKECCREKAKPNATRDICNLIIDLANKESALK
ncbi:MGDG synthase family glycosyltransferase [Thermobrachium celere]|uniref:1,2-diacylglycerol 3-glucosyltransferase diglucosyldiacylglycerol synthase (LTA membrane anchor synthesis) putative n=1 Tax=Thermobrachium celere DSM 8682 TaxID=941824 RepID=R7RMG9_9CLOT|nr:glycosyltransferase [Thermobrachium celere]CDF57239.1 1,2-diacylglycerol 3-glucosyltransferase; diglucosyldiacylglycerol synthase (LTA membrane anchor synthesis); putative [Thermobrachium celere DSM 8682]